jgi:hypothetical protein
MKKFFALITIAIAIAACTNDDRYTWNDDFADRTDTDTINIRIGWMNDHVIVDEHDIYGFVNVDGTDVTVKSNTNKFLNLHLYGECADGSLTIYSWKKLGITLEKLSLTNPDGPAINNQCSKALYVILDSDDSSISDGAAYAERDIDQKGTLFSEGQIYFQGSGTLTINGNCRNGIASDDYIMMQGGTVEVNMASAATNGVKVNDGFTMQGGELRVNVKGDGARGIKCDARTTIEGGNITITTTGDCRIEEADGVRDTTSAAGIKSDSLFTMTGGQLTIISSGDGGKGINCSENVEFKGGTLNITTTGSNDVGKPKGVKSDMGIIVSGGSFTVNVKKSWALDNGFESEEPEDRVTVVGTPVTKRIAKRSVDIRY